MRVRDCVHIHHIFNSVILHYQRNVARQLLKSLSLIALRSDKPKQDPLYALNLPWADPIYLIKIVVAAPPALALVVAVVVAFAGADPGA